MMKHKYVHYEYMFECKHCEKGFHFESQLREHLHVHQSQGDWTCFKPKCRKRFKHESELNAHLIAHNKRSTSVISVPILIRILKTVEHINVNTVTENCSYAPNVVRGSNGCNKDTGTLTQKNVKTLHPEINGLLQL